MKNSILALLLLASVGRADIVGPMTSQQLDTVAVWPISGSSPTYALSSALTGVASSAIDMDGATGMYLTVTMTGSGIMDIIQTNSNLTYGAKVYSIQIPGSYNVPIRARYVTLRNSGNNLPTARATAYYYKAVPVITASVSVGDVSVTNTVTVTGNVSITAQAGYTRLTATAYTGVTTNATVSLGLTATAGTSAYKSLVVKLWVKSGVTAINATIHPTSTPPATFAAGTGPEFFPSDNLKTVGLPVNITDGNVYYLSFVASALSGAASGTVWYEIWGQ